MWDLHSLYLEANRMVLIHQILSSVATATVTDAILIPFSASSYIPIIVFLKIFDVLTLKLANEAYDSCWSKPQLIRHEVSSDLFIHISCF